MRIIQPGTKKPPTYRGECTKCGCIFEEQEDKLSVVHDQRDGSFAEVRCPQCSSRSFMYRVRS